jgi:hypothetical protein
VVAAGWAGFYTLVTVTVTSRSEPVLTAAAEQRLVLVGEGLESGPLLTLSWRVLKRRNPNDDEVTMRFTLELDLRESGGAPKWLGLGFSGSAKMVGGDAYICNVRAGAASPVLFYSMTGMTPSAVEQQTCSTTLGSMQYADGVSTMSFGHTLSSAGSTGCVDAQKLPCALAREASTAGLPVLDCDEAIVLWA